MFRSLFSQPRSNPSYHQTLTLEIGGRPVALAIRHNARAKRYTLRLAQKGYSPILTIPKHGTYDEALNFALRHVDWLAERLAAKPPVVRFSPGSLIPFRGQEHLLQPSGRLRGNVKLGGDEQSDVILVSGLPEHFERKVIDWLKKQARADITRACRYHADNLGLHFRSITLRDQRTRWGSCSSDGRLNFSWRLILAPPEVLDYVAAHEVAHLEEMNHQPQFWALVEKTCPDMQKHRGWLRENGHRLHAFHA